MSAVSNLRFRRLVVIAVVFLAFGVDVLSKYFAENALSDGKNLRLFNGWIVLRLFFNHGASLGIGSAEPMLVSVVVIFIIGFLVLWLLRASSYRVALPLALVVGGSLGNLADRIFRSPSVLYGAVVDWISFSKSGVVFNLADVEIRLGLILIAVLYLFRSQAVVDGNPEEESRLCHNADF